MKWWIIRAGMAHVSYIHICIMLRWILRSSKWFGSRSVGQKFTSTTKTGASISTLDPSPEPTHPSLELSPSFSPSRPSAAFSLCHCSFFGQNSKGKPRGLIQGQWVASLLVFDRPITCFRGGILRVKNWGDKNEVRVSLARVKLVKHQKILPRNEFKSDDSNFPTFMRKKTIFLWF